MTADAATPPTLDATDAPLSDLTDPVAAALEAHGAVDLIVPDPDAHAGAWPGERRADGAVQRSWRDWCDLADAVRARLGTPTRLVGDGPARCRVRLERLASEASFHDDDDRATRYRPDGAFARLRKMELPGFLLPLREALRFAAPTPPATVLVLGCHRGDEVEVVRRLHPGARPPDVVGVDANAEALAEARRSHPSATFVRADVRELPADLGRFDLIVAIAILQSPELDGPAILRSLVRDHATPAGGLVIGLPASRFRDGEVLWGARTRNFAEADLSLVVRDLAGHRRYLHQHGYRTRIGGRYDLLLAARRGAAGQDVIMRA
jgi:hypothetical protein